MKKNKGQILVFEQVLLFVIGVAVLISTFSLFILYQNFYLTTASEDQLNQVKEYIFSNIVRLTKTKANASLVLNIPKTISNRYYKISLTNAYLNLSLEPNDAYTLSSLSALNESFNFSGRVISTNGKVVLYKKDNWINLES
ncbi:MAG: hypothetical protein QW051_02815 [Candidatus Aenigmatarchaeota archaeon]